MEKLSVYPRVKLDQAIAVAEDYAREEDALADLADLLREHADRIEASVSHVQIRSADPARPMRRFVGHL